MKNNNSQPSLYEIFFCFFKLGMTSFGGPAMIPYIRHETVENRGWVKSDDFAAGTALAQIVPGATAMQAAAWAGLCTRGTAGALSAYLGFALPAFIMICSLSALYITVGQIPAMDSMFNGLKAVVTAIVAHAALSFSEIYLKSLISRFFAFVVGCWLAFNGNPILILLIVCLLSCFTFTSISGQESRTADTSPKIKTKLLFILVLPLMLGILFLFGNPYFQLAWTMIKIDFFAFGGGYVALPLMLHEVVEVNNWMSQSQFMDGIALGQVTPGPIVMTSAFIGFFVKGLSGAAVATAAVFSPSFIIINLTAPFYERLLSSAYLQRALYGSLITLTGLMAAMAGKFLLMLRPQFTDIFVLFIAFILLRRQVNIVKVVPLCAVISLISGTIFS